MAYEATIRRCVKTVSAVVTEESGAGLFTEPGPGDSGNYLNVDVSIARARHGRRQVCKSAIEEPGQLRLLGVQPNTQSGNGKAVLRMSVVGEAAR